MRINGNITGYKAADEIVDSGGNGTNANDNIERIEQAMEKIDTAIEQYGKTMSEADVGDLVAMKAMLSGLKAAYESGDANAVQNAIDGSFNGLIPELSTDLSAGWNGTFSEVASSNESLSHLTAEEKALWQKYIGEFGSDTSFGELISIIRPFSNSDPNNPYSLVFQLTDNMSGLKVVNKGDDLIVTISYENGTKKSYVVQGFAHRPEAFTIDCTKLTHGAKIDLSESYRFDNRVFKAGEWGLPVDPYSFVVFGSKHNDDIKGSKFAKNYIVGGAGSDRITGGIKRDYIWGDFINSAAVGANDFIDGLTGDDIIVGGGGYDTFVVNERAYTSEVENAIRADMSPPENIGSALSPLVGWSYDPATGEITGSGGSIEINLDPISAMGKGNYNTVMGQMNGSDLEIIFISDELNTDGLPKRFVLTVKDFFRETSEFGQVTQLTIKGTSGNDIMDFSAIKMEGMGHSINLIGGKGNDIICEPENILSSLKVDVKDCEKSSDSKAGEYAKVDSIIDTKDTAEDKAKKWDVSYDKGMIVINRKEGCTEPLAINAPAGYKNALSYTDGDGNIYIVLVKERAGGKSDTIVIKVTAESGLSLNGGVENGIIIQQDNSTAPITPVVIGEILNDESLFKSEGGEGDDILFGPRYGTTSTGFEQKEYYSATPTTSKTELDKDSKDDPSEKEPETPAT